jgi:dehydrogenase/reductase SDR family protein 12
MTAKASVLDAALEATVVGSFSRLGLDARRRLLPEFAEDPQSARPGQLAVITGATSGLGLATATALAGRGFSVHFLARSAQKARQAQDRIGAAATAGAEVSSDIADVEDLDSVRVFARDTLNRYDRVDVLIHNAGAIHDQYETGSSGAELTVTGHVLAPFLLTHLALPALTAAAPSRVITVSSGGMYAQRLDMASLIRPAADYRGAAVYALAKRAQVILNREWARRFGGSGIAFQAMHPGWADTPGVVASLPRFYQLMKPILRSPEEGADTIVWLATAPAVELGTGKFWHDRRPRTEYLLPWTREAAGVGRQLWDWAAAQTGIPTTGQSTLSAPR